MQLFLQRCAQRCKKSCIMCLGLKRLTETERILYKWSLNLVDSNITQSLSVFQDQTPIILLQIIQLNLFGSNLTKDTVMQSGKTSRSKIFCDSHLRRTTLSFGGKIVRSRAALLNGPTSSVASLQPPLQLWILNVHLYVRLVMVS